MIRGCRMAINQRPDDRDADERDIWTQPALDVLDDDQGELREELLGGFGCLTEVINWWQSAAVLTFGHIDDEWPAVDLLRDGAMLTFLTEDSQVAEAERLRYQTELFAPSCNDAYNHLKERAVERLPTSDDGETFADIETAAQDDPAMRPAFSILDDRQQQALTDLWGGFEDTAALSEWLHDLNAASYGEIDRETARSLTSDPVTKEFLLDQDSRDGRLFRKRLAITELLPAFALAAKRLQAGESTDNDTAQSDSDSFNTA